jgi:site-specific recombinase XerD
MKRRVVILFTDETCEINGRVQTELPLLLDAQRAVIESASDWLRYQAVFLNYPPATLRLYAEILALFWNYLTDHRTHWTDVDDELLIAWRNHQEIKLKVKKRTINQRLSTIFQFYWWAQTRGYANNIVTDPAADDRPPAPISVALTPIRSNSRVHPNFTLRSPLLYKTTRQPNVHTPTAEEATNLHATLAGLHSPRVAERNTLMLSWAEEAGLRRKEFAALAVEQIPDWNDLYSLVEQDLSKDIELSITKGGHSRIIEVVPDLLIRTRNYIEEERNDVVDRFKTKYGSGYAAPSTIFLSEKTGKALHLRSITNLISGAFRRANISGSGHRMRARFLTNLVQFYYDEALAKHGRSVSLDIVLLKAAEAAGHANPESLRPYLNLVRKRHLTTKGRERLRYNEQRLLSVSRRLESKSRQLETSDVLQELSQAIRSGRKTEIRKAWRRVETSVGSLL